MKKVADISLLRVTSDSNCWWGCWLETERLSVFLTAAFVSHTCIKPSQSKCLPLDEWMFILFLSFFPPPTHSFPLYVRFLLFRPFLLLDLHFHDVIVLAYSGHVVQLKKKIFIFRILNNCTRNYWLVRFIYQT